MTRRHRPIAALLAVLLSLAAPQVVSAQGPAIGALGQGFAKAGQGARPVAVSQRTVRAVRPAARQASQPQLRPWMHADIADAWNAGYRGQGATVTVVDSFERGARIVGDLGNGRQSLRHGDWTQLELSLLAPQAQVRRHDMGAGRRVGLGDGLNIVNLSYAMYAPAGHNPARIAWSGQEGSVIRHARQGTALVVKAAGNDGIALGRANRAGRTDYLNLALVGSDAAIFVGALDRNGSPTDRAELAHYSNRPGHDRRVQRQFLTVGVRGDLTGLDGTSFAAPVVSGYAAVLGSKFSDATPTQIGNRLLDTARTDTIRNYNPAQHGRGEASLARALAPARIR